MLLIPPNEMLALAAIAGVFAIYFTWLLRSEWLGDGLDGWAMLEHVVSHFLLLGMLGSAALQVTTRHFLSDYVSLPWTEEFGRLMMIWAALWGAAMVQRGDEHISMTVLFDWLPEGWKRWVQVFGDVVTLAVLVPIIWLGWHSAVSLDVMFTIALGLPLSVFAYSIPIAGGLMILHAIVLIIRRVLNRPIPTVAPPPEF